MDDIDAIIAEASALGLSLRVSGEKLKVDAPPKVKPSSDLMERLTKNKTAIIARLNGEPTAEELPPAKSIRKVTTFTPFPISLLPNPIRGYVSAAGDAIGIDPSFVALPIIAALGSAIGNTRRIELKPGWQEPPILWTAIVGDSGTLKTPSLSAATERLEYVQNKHFAEHQAAMDAFVSAQLNYAANLEGWKKTKGVRGDAPEAPQAPVMPRVMVSDVTVESLADRLQDSPRGLLLMRDELAGWLQSFGQYKAGKGGDVAHWLSMYNAKPLRIDRKTGSTFTFVPSAAVSICGGIQPETLRRCLSSEHWENGLAARLLLTAPPKRPRVWSEKSIPDKLRYAVSDVFDLLLDLKFGTDADGNETPIIIPLDRQAKSVWIDFYNRHGIEQASLSGREAALWSKLEGTAPRLALVIHLIRCAAGDANPNAIDEASMTVAVSLAEWFGQEATRIYGMLSETDEERDQRRLVDLIERKGGSVTARELMRSSNQWSKRTADETEQALDALVKSGCGNWEQVSHDAQGRPTRRFRLSTSIDTDTIPPNSGKTPIVSMSVASMELNPQLEIDPNDLLAEAATGDERGGF